MATAIVASPATQILDQAKAKFEPVQKTYLALGEKLGALKRQLVEEEGTFAAVTNQYNGACRDVALGKEGDPVGYKTAMDRLQHKILGLKSVIAEAERELEPVTAQYRAVSLEVTRAQNGLKLEELVGILKSKQDAFNEAARAADTALKAQGEAASLLGRFRNEIARFEEDVRRGNI